MNKNIINHNGLDCLFKKGSFFGGESIWLVNVPLNTVLASSRGVWVK